jgi:hypothetical protein
VQPGWSSGGGGGRGGGGARRGGFFRLPPLKAPNWLKPSNWKWPWSRPVDCSADEPTIPVYHKGELLDGQVGSHRPLSTGTNRDTVSALKRKGAVHEFRIPLRKLNEWERQGRVRRLYDEDKETGVRNDELRFSSSLADEMNNCKVK